MTNRDSVSAIIEIILESGGDKQEKFEKLIDEIYQSVGSCKDCKHSEKRKLFPMGLDTPPVRYCTLYRATKRDDGYCDEFEEKQ